MTLMARNGQLVIPFNNLESIMPVTTDPDDTRLTSGVDAEPVSQAPAYLVLSQAEIAKGFVRPLRSGYVHRGAGGPRYETRPLTEQEQERFAGFNYVLYEEYPEDRDPIRGRYWTQAQLDAANNGCGSVTTMNLRIAETYARDPKFYGSTYCVACRKHLPVDEFVWVGTTERVGS